MPSCTPGGTPAYLSPAEGYDPSTGLAYCPAVTVHLSTGPGPGYSFDGLSLPISALHDGTNEIAVMYEERYGAGGIDHLVLTVTTAPPSGADGG
jgi:hypothetical protein